MKPPVNPDINRFKHMGAVMPADTRDRLAISADRLQSINEFLMSPDNKLIDQLLKVIDKYGGVNAIREKAAEAGKLENLISQLKELNSPYLADVEWLVEQKEKRAFISLEEYTEKARRADSPKMRDDSFAVTLEISACNFFPWINAEARRSIEKGDLMPGRYIRVRGMKESEGDRGDLVANAAAMRVLGASYVETLDTKGTDGANVHLGGPETIAGYFGGVGQPNEYAIQWIDEYLNYHTTYGVKQVLNLNPGTVLLGYMLHKLGVDMEFKISVFMGNDNPYSVMWTLLTAKLLSRDDGTTPLIGFNFSNSVNNETIELSARVREAFDFDEVVRFEHHITETFKSIVRQPYDRRDELVEVAASVKNISAKHEGGDPETDGAQEHPSDILDYFIPQADIEEAGIMPALLGNYLLKHEAVNSTARALLAAGIPVVASEVHG